MGTDDPSRGLYGLPMYIDGEIYTGFTPIEGSGTVHKPVIISEVEIDINYHIEIVVYNIYGDDILLMGNIKFIESNGKIDYIFDGMARTLTIDGYEIIDYT